MKKLQKGFTLIELLVVIAIIGILSSIVLASLSSARTKGEDAAIQSTLSNMRAQAELFYNDQTPNSYGTTQVGAAASCDGTVSTLFSATGGLGTLAAGLVSRAGTGATKTVCMSNGSEWVAAAVLKSAATSAYCVDSTGVSKLMTINSGITLTSRGAAAPAAVVNGTNLRCN